MFQWLEDTSSSLAFNDQNKNNNNKKILKNEAKKPNFVYFKFSIKGQNFSLDIIKVSVQIW